ncbi:MAG: hypothetical protein ACI9MR_004334 [Myxococcota bacterium]|jgi:hypothetical protein
MPRQTRSSGWRPRERAWGFATGGREASSCRSIAGASLATKRPSLEAGTTASGSDVDRHPADLSTPPRRRRRSRCHQHARASPPWGDAETSTDVQLNLTARRCSVCQPARECRPDCCGLSASYETAIAAQPPLTTLTMPFFFMRERSVFGCIPRIIAAAPSPSTRQPVDSSTPTI